MRLSRKSKFTKAEMLLFTALFAFSSFIMFKTFSITPEGNIKFASKLWSDFGATIPLIRSFSFGSNFSPQYPIFSGYPIRYHFLFFLAVGILERLGLPLDWALNSLSSVSLFLLLLAIYYFGKLVFKNKAIGTLSVIFFLFNGSLGFLEFFKKNPLSAGTLRDIVNNSSFTSFGPYDGKIVSAFWSLNIFTNQRHLALAYAAFLFLLITIYKAATKPKFLSWKKTFLLGFLVGIFPFTHLAVFGMMGIALITTLLLYPKLRLKIFTVGTVALILAIPQIAYMGKSQVEVKFFNPGYLVENLTVFDFMKYWFFNLGVSLIVAPIGFLMAKKNQKKIFLPFLVLFVVGNLFQFSPERAANHKFFNLFVIGANFFVAGLVCRLWNKNFLSKVLAAILFASLTLTGVIDFFPIINDQYIELADYPKDPTVKFIVENTPKNSVFLNSSFLYDPASLGGRIIFLGWPYFPWSAGYNTERRTESLRSILRPETSKAALCEFFRKNEIDYLESPVRLDAVDVVYTFSEKEFSEIYRDINRNLRIYSVYESCVN